MTDSSETLATAPAAHPNPAGHPSAMARPADGALFNELQVELVSVRNLLKRHREHPTVEHDEDLAQALRLLKLAVDYALDAVTHHA